MDHLRHVGWYSLQPGSGHGFSGLCPFAAVASFFFATLSRVELLAFFFYLPFGRPALFRLIGAGISLTLPANWPSVTQLPTSHSCRAQMVEQIFGC